jgi:hypothetical protein
MSSPALQTAQRYQLIVFSSLSTRGMKFNDRVRKFGKEGDMVRVEWPALNVNQVFQEFETGSRKQSSA